MKLKIDNTEQCKSLLEFETEDDFYHLQILRRKKDDNPDMGADNILVRTFYVRSMEYFERVIPEIKAICLALRARAYINLNKRSFRRTALGTLKILADRIAAEEYMPCRKAYESSAGKHSAAKEKRWLIDIDYPFDRMEELENILNDLKPDGEKILARIPTVNGEHLICKPFDLQSFNRMGATLQLNLQGQDVKKDSPTLLLV